MTKAEYDAIFFIPDVDISKISSCNQRSITDCERNCSRYFNCSTIAYANDLLTEYEQSKQTYK